MNDWSFYAEFLAMVIVPNMYGNADRHYEEHAERINHVAAGLRSRFGVPNDVLYRGILVADEYVVDGRLRPADHCRYLSFSTDISVAEEFADINSGMSEFLKFQNPFQQGYLITHQPDPGEVLYHHAWGEHIGITRWRLPVWDVGLINRQKEVVIAQSGEWFELAPFQKQMEKCYAVQR